MYSRSCCIVLMLVCTMLILGGCSESSSDSRASSWLGVGTNDPSSDLYRLKMEAGSLTVGAGQTLPLLLNLTTFGDVPVKQAAIKISSSNGGTFDGDDSTSDQGFAHKTFTAGNTAGTTLITASAFDVVATISIQVQPSNVAVAKVTVFVASEVIKPSQSMPVQVYVANESGVALDAVRVLLSTASGRGAFAADDGSSESGWFTTTFTAPDTAGQETITALVLGQTGSKTISVRE